MAKFNRSEMLQFALDSIVTSEDRSYLEIGCKNDSTFANIRAAKKIGVDPVSGGTHRMLSDDFFATNKETFDLVFIDGDHTAEQVLTDFLNAWNVLNKGGIIAMHDCNPATRELEEREACGTAWKTAYTLKDVGLDMLIGNFDHGLTFVKIKHQPTDGMTQIIGETFNEFIQMTYDDLEKIRETSTVDEIKDWLIPKGYAL